MTAVDLIEQVAADLVAIQPKGIVEGAARSNDAQIVVEHHERIANSIDDGMRERDSVFHIDEWRILRQRRS